MATFKRLRGKQTAKEVATKLGISESAYRKYECYSRLPRPKVILKMSLAYGCTSNEVYEALEQHQLINANRRKLNKKC